MAACAKWIDGQAEIEALLRTDFPSFVRKVFKELCPASSFSDAAYLHAIAYQLERGARGEIRRLIVTIPPRHLKSIMISVASVAWRLGHDPSLRFICVSYNNELAAKLSRDCRQIIQSEWYRKLFPGTELRRATEMELETAAGGGRLATSIGGTLTGLGADIIIIDDPMKADDAMSATVRQSVREWTTSTLFSRLNNKSSGAIIVVMQRLHEDDLAGYFLERGGWEHLNLPAICEERQSYPLGDGRNYTRLPGDVLDPQREPLEVLEQIRRELGGQAFSAQYQQSPVPAGGVLVKANWLSYYDAAPTKQPGDVIGQSWDTASKDGALNDHSVCITFLVRKNTIYILKVFRRQLEFPDLLRVVQCEAESYRPDVLLIEDAASGQQLIQTLRNNPPAHVPTPIACKPDADKITRLSACTPVIEAGDLVLPSEAPWLMPFLKELLSFPHGKFDDQVDALSQLLTWTRNRPKLIIPVVYLDTEPTEPSKWSDGAYVW